MTPLPQFEWSAGIILFSRSLEEVLLICDKKGVWRFPSGRLSPGESFVEAASREFLEETNIPRAAYTVVLSPIPVVSRKKPAKEPETPRFVAKIRLLFPAILRSGELAKVDPLLGITSDAAWLTPKEATLATRNVKRAAAILLGHAVVKGVRPTADHNLDELAFAPPIGDGGIT